MLVPEVWCLGVALECLLDRNDLAFWNWQSSHTVDPPISEFVVDLHVNQDCWWRCFCKCICYVASEGDQTLRCCDRRSEQLL